MPTKGNLNQYQHALTKVAEFQQKAADLRKNLTYENHKLVLIVNAKGQLTYGGNVFTSQEIDKLIDFLKDVRKLYES